MSKIMDIKNLSFSYENKTIFNNLNLTLKGII